MQIDRKHTVMIIGGAGIAATAACGFESLIDLPFGDLWAFPLAMGTIGVSSNDSELHSDEERLLDEVMPLTPKARHEGLASIGHAYKNIFQIILGHTYLALENLDSSDPQRSHLEQVQRSAQQGAQLADRIHHLSEELMNESRLPTTGDPGS